MNREKLINSASPVCSAVQSMLTPPAKKSEFQQYLSDWMDKCRTSKDIEFFGSAPSVREFSDLCKKIKRLVDQQMPELAYLSDSDNTDSDNTDSVVSCNLSLSGIVSSTFEEWIDHLFKLNLEKLSEDGFGLPKASLPISTLITVVMNSVAENVGSNRETVLTHTILKYLEKVVGEDLPVEEFDNFLMDRLDENEKRVFIIRLNLFFNSFVGITGLAWEKAMKANYEQFESESISDSSEKQESQISLKSAADAEIKMLNNILEVILEKYPYFFLIGIKEKSYHFTEYDMIEEVGSHSCDFPVLGSDKFSHGISSLTEVNGKMIHELVVPLLKEKYKEMPVSMINSCGDRVREAISQSFERCLGGYERDVFNRPLCEIISPQLEIKGEEVYPARVWLILNNSKDCLKDEKFFNTQRQAKLVDFFLSDKEKWNDLM
ncbi:MAG: hypothetical protein OEL89_04790, partial [Candidatus Peregrinibacteria bacterium]|nr:hypothetical protein [Candidatus Peregrinibacteria bacterium]